MLERILFRSHLSLLCFVTASLLQGCMAANPSSVGKDDIVVPSPENPEWLFTLPDCLPNCTAADRTALTERGRIEGLLVNVIDSATSNVSFSIYTFSRKPIYEALVRAASRGVQVRGIVDRGQFRNLLDQCSPTEGCEVTAAPYATTEYQNASIEERLRLVADDERFRAASNTEKLALLLQGTASASSIKPAPGSRRLVHNKFVIVDGRLLLNGSGNWSSTAVSINLENLSRFTNESHPRVVSAFSCAFAVLWTGDANTFSRGLRQCETDAVKFSPAPRTGDNPVTLITEAAAQATSSIDIAMHHLTNSNVFGALEDALARGVSVRLLLDDDDCNSQLDEDLAALIMTGAVVRYMPSNCSLFQLSHNKFGIFDGQAVINGSGNWSNAGLTTNYENFLLLKEASDIEPFRTFYERAWGIATERAACTCQAGDTACLQSYCVGNSP